MGSELCIRDSTKEAVRLISVFLHGLSANMAAGMKVKKARALLHDQLDLVLLPKKKFKSSKLQ